MGDQEQNRFVEWVGYFAGVKGDLVFLNDSEGDDNSGIPFTVFEARGLTKYFEDSATARNPREKRLSFSPAPSGQILVRYLRVASAGCSIPKSGQNCWRKLQQKTGLVHFAMPKCSDYKGWEAGKVPSVIAYPVEVSFYPNPSIRPIGAPIRCYPQN